ncbi:MAG: hypothetical protein CGU28_05705 [Candidatus Dactylopiibacterium carminicum]|nr:hypothetical protein [Candidatus Dactylopiibacterium carminicum]PAS93938.1 MAG: hypothetical protein CGU29_05755 [Candidatus Dactylopiibacterium carminicum]PAS97254.1 MAG: hypothetical protein CGU28_05705 [Candidatus Dactylopiibacterium carminicum]PAS99866.1 MAG: hypothetical protein BSR46_05780 [Candidatus Dactylopiibacterium carminicum]
MQTSVSHNLPTDTLAELAPEDVQQQAARLVQEAFGVALRLATSQGLPREEAINRLAGHLREWTALSSSEQTQLRMAMLLGGLDQWGLAYSQLLTATELAGVSMLIGDLRAGLDLSAEALCQRFLDGLREDEASALSYKILLRRELHLSLWHALISCNSREEAEPVMRLLVGMLLALVQAMPQLGWRLIADAMASIQIRCLQHGLAVEGLSRDLTEGLFASLSEALPEAARAQVVDHAAEAARAWRDASQPKH